MALLTYPFDVRWRARAGDWVAGVSMLVVMVVGGSIVFGASLPDLTWAPAEEAGALPALPTDTPFRTHEVEPTPEARKSPRPRPRPQPEPRKREVKVEDVPESGTGMKIILPGTGVAGPVEATTVDVVFSSFNVLGTSHTRPGGDRPGYAPGAVRARWAAQLIAQHDVDIAGLQELQDDQMRTIMSALPGFDIFPGPSMTWREAENSIIWRSDEWEAVQTSTIAIPYFRGSIRHMPYVRLRNLETGTDVWVANFHNPANTRRFGNNSRWRAEATRRQIRLANLLRDETGLPVVFTGDFNERELFYCRLAGSTALEASSGGTAERGRCAPPPRPGIDWVLGTPELEWLASVTDRGPLVRRTTDHPMVVAKAQLSVMDESAVDEATKGLDRVRGSLERRSED